MVIDRADSHRPFTEQLSVGLCSFFTAMRSTRKRSPKGYENLEGTRIKNVLTLRTDAIVIFTKVEFLRPLLFYL